MTQEERKEYIKKLPPEQRKKLMEEASIMMVIRDLGVPTEKHEEFKTLLKEYLKSQKAIKDKFRPDFSSENLSDADAKKMLYQSFDVGQQLLNNRKVYAEKFLKILTPQQVLKMYKNEGKMRNKLMNKKKQMKSQKGKGPMMKEELF